MEILRGPLFDKFISENRKRTLLTLKSLFPELSEDDLKDVYQESSLALYINIETGKLSELTSSLYTYFLRICINQSKKALRTLGVNSILSINQENNISESKLNQIILSTPVTPKKPESSDDKMMIEEMKMLVNEALNDMAEKCRQLLKSHYCEELSWVIIAIQLGIKGGANQAKAEAQRCRNRFEEKHQYFKRLYNLKRRKNKTYNKKNS